MRPASASAAAAAAASCKVVWVRPAAANAASPFTGGVGAAARGDRVTWERAVRQLAKRLAFVNPAFALEDCVLGAEGWQAAVAKADLVVGGDLGTAAAELRAAAAAVPNVIFVGSAAPPPKLGGREAGGGPVDRILALLPFTDQAKAAALRKALDTFRERSSPDDVLFALLSVINEFVAEVPEVQVKRALDPASFYSMVSNCFAEIQACVSDPECKAALDCLDACDDRDQVGQYQCIVSYETPLLEDFSLCILQKNNCLSNSAAIPERPVVPPLDAWRGEPMSHDLAEQIFCGVLGDGPGKEQWSWRVVAGQNPAYDFFPNQYQIFYREKGRKRFWYDPVFQVETLDGRKVWRRRHYSVNRRKTPGTFTFQVLDNGVISREYWTIVACDEALDWALFYYAGAASAAGLSYSGAILASPDGRWPGPEHDAGIAEALAKASIEPWELFDVKNSPDAAGAPLETELDYEVVEVVSRAR